MTGVVKPLCENLIMHLFFFSGGSYNAYVVCSCMFFIFISKVVSYFIVLYNTASIIYFGYSFNCINNSGVNNFLLQEEKNIQ